MVLAETFELNCEILARSGVVMPLSYLLALVLLAVWCGMVWARVSTYSSTTVVGRYADVAASWWKINFSLRDEARTVENLMQAFPVPIQLVSKDSYLLVAAGLSLASPKGGAFLKRIVSRAALGDEQLQLQ